LTFNIVENRIWVVNIRKEAVKMIKLMNGIRLNVLMNNTMQPMTNI